MIVHEAHLVSQAFEEGGLKLGDEWLEAWARFGNEQANGVQQGCLDLPGQAVTNDPDHGACTHIWSLIKSSFQSQNVYFDSVMSSLHWNSK